MAHEGKTVVTTIPGRHHSADGSFSNPSRTRLMRYRRYKRKLKKPLKVQRWSRADPEGCSLSKGTHRMSLSWRQSPHWGPASVWPPCQGSCPADSRETSCATALPELELQHPQRQGFLHIILQLRSPAKSSSQSWPDQVPAAMALPLMLRA